MSCTGMAFFPANFMLQTPPPPPSHSSSPHEDDHLQPSLTPSNINPHDYHGVASFLGKRSMSFSAGLDVCTEEMNNEDELSDDCNSQVGEKKKRLNMEQVKTLEKNFELGNKLEPERKMQLARALGLQPRQIAIWFQNRRARWKTKQLEKDYDLLKRQFEALKSDNDVLQNQNKKLQAEIMILKKSRDTEAINLNKLETEGSCSIKSENSSDLNLDISRTAVDSPLSPQAIRPIFPPLRPPSVVQFFHESATTRPDHITNHHHHHHQHQLQHHKFMPASSAGDHDHHNQAAGPEEPFCNMFCSMDEQPSFWPWPDNSPHAFH